jgi:hypothetical protein
MVSLKKVMFEKVLVPKKDSYMGRMIEVEIIECSKFSMKGKVIDEDCGGPARPVAAKLGTISGGGGGGQLHETVKTNGECCGSGAGCCASSNHTLAHAENDSGCCSSESELEKCCGSAEKKVLTKPHAESSSTNDKNHLKEYACATLFAFGVILLSKIALKVFYPNK